MKKVLIFLLAAVVGVAGTLLVQQLLNKGPAVATAGSIVPAEKNSFAAVTKNLDPGGTFYMYLGSEKIIETIQKAIAGIRETAVKQAKDPVKKKWLEQVSTIVTNLLDNSGLFEISGVGVSSVPIGDDFHQGKFVIHHYPDKGRGLIWNIWEDAPHALDSQKLLPANTVFAEFADARLDYLWEWLNKEAAASGIPEVAAGLKQLKPMLKQKGIDLDEILASLAGRMGFIVTFDESKMCKIPIMNKEIEIPEPAAALVIYVKNDAVFKLLQKIAPIEPQVNGKITKIVSPQALPLPITVQPVMAQKENLFIFASNGKIVDDIFAAQEGGKGLTAGEEFKKMSANMPGKGNRYTFLSAKVFAAITAIRKKMVVAADDETKEMFAVLDKVNLFPENLSFYNVLQNTNEGLVVASHNNLGVGGMVLIPAAVVGGLVAYFSIKGGVVKDKGEQKGGQKATMGDLKSISMAVEAYMMDNGKAPEAQTILELKPILEPFYIKVLPIKDGWGFDFHYMHGAGDKQEEYFIGSGGKDGIFEGFDQNGFYEVTGPQDFQEDIIISNGAFVYGPKVK
ncbi:MAG: type II secretion system protein GspG [Candidatus Aminicenantes bacterium]|nr:type II secretion system protein GspG [Candidatus Aminicenantes bacterium]